MKVINDCIWLCQDCMLVSAFGTAGVQCVNEKATVDGLQKLGPNVVPNFDSETREGIEEFSHVKCEACGTSDAGYRARHSQLGLE